jgi:catechol-2,3-dioxygenase
MIGHLASVVLETRDPAALAGFYSELLGLPVTSEDGDWVDIADGSTAMSFQLAPDHQPPRFPDPGSSMQFHLDITVDDIERAEPAALALGATRLPWGSAEEEERGLRPAGPSGFRVYADPAGHPFCLCWG